MNKPLCFILMPFGIKKDSSGRIIDFDSIYHELIKPAVEEAGLEPIRADEEKAGGMIHKAMSERLILCDYAVADLTTANANVFYELGVRHALRPYKTVLLFNDNMQIPFDLSNLRAMPYKIDKNGKLEDRENDYHNLKKKLVQIKTETHVDSPLFQLFAELKSPALDHEKTDVFRERVLYSQKIKEELEEARNRKTSEETLRELKQIENQFGDITDVESGILIDLFLSYRSEEAWKEMINLVSKFPQPLAQRIMIQEQLGFALNRFGKSEKAEEILLQIIKSHGPSSETNGILGRVYKDRWEKALKTGEKAMADALLEKAIDTYLKGFEADFRDAYPGINALSLIEIKDPNDKRKKEILPVVTYAVKQKVARGQSDYWDYATLLELAILADNPSEANHYLGQALISIRESWEPQTTARNLKLIMTNREKQSMDIKWIKQIVDELLKKR